jgi:hypothetical protein
MPPPYPEITVPMHAADIETALADLAASFRRCALGLSLRPPREGRSQSYIKLASGSGNRPDALFIGGIHAREWVPPDALLSFARNLLVAFTNSTDVVFPAVSVKPLGGHPVGYRSWRIPKADVNRIPTTLDVYLFPLVNPSWPSRSSNMSEKSTAIRTRKKWSRAIRSTRGPGETEFEGAS